MRQSTPEAPAHSVPGARRLFGPFTWLCIVAFLLYPLSIGPALKLERHFPQLRPGFLVVYAPIEVLCTHSAFAYGCYGWYAEGLWGIK